jgi:methionyl aminopeptidase
MHWKPRTSITTGELDAIAAAIFRRYGARSAPALVYKFPGTVLISVNDEIVHGVPGARMLLDGDVVKLDVTVERDGYVADAARASRSSTASADTAAAARFTNRRRCRTSTRAGSGMY